MTSINFKNRLKSGKFKNLNNNFTVKLWELYGKITLEIEDIQFNQRFIEKCTTNKKTTIIKHF